MEQIRLIIWQAQQGLAGIGWGVGETWDRIGDVGHRVLAVFGLVALLFTICGLIEKKWHWLDDDEESEQQEREPRVSDTGELFAVQVEANGPVVTREQEDEEDLVSELAHLKAHNPEMQEARIGAFPLDWTMESANAAMHRFSMRKKLRGEA